MIIGIGCDVVDLNRITLAIGERILTEQEKQLLNGKSQKRQLEFIAGRFAAKEAIIKALNVEGAVLSEIEVLYEGNKPVCKYKDYKIKVSISHDAQVAIAFAICEV